MTQSKLQAINPFSIDIDDVSSNPSTTSYNSPNFYHILSISQESLPTIVEGHPPGREPLPSRLVRMQITFKLHKHEYPS